MKKIPLIINITKNIKFQNSNIYVSGFCLTKLIGIKDKDISKIKAQIGEKKYNINFLFKNGLLFIKKYRLNYYKFYIPISDLLTDDIQNKIILNYNDEYKGRILYNIFDFLKGKNRNSKIINIGYNKVVYLRQTIKNTMYITVREKNYFDTFNGTLEIIIGNIISKLIINKNKILLYEKECNKYEESASILYEKLIDKGYKNIYYILDKNNFKYNDIKEKYKNNIINKNSLKHIIYFFNCNNFIATESLAHALQLRIANRTVQSKINKKNIKYVFLQHGVMYMVSLNSDLRTGFKKMDIKLHKIVVSSELEAQHFIDLGGFSKDDLYICGLPKFDKAVRNKNADKIVIMPTWRRWEVNDASIDYENTNYFKMIKRIINYIPAKYKNKIIILPHPLMINAIKNNKEYTKYLPNENFSYDDILKQCKILITDYSSISFDAFYRGSNVIFYWEEKDECMKHYGNDAFLMLNENNCFGDICYNAKEISNSILNNYSNTQNKKYINNYKKIVKFDDNNNTERLIHMLINDKMI